MDHQTRRWEPDRASPGPAALPPMTTMLLRGAMNRCPACGQGKVFQSYLRVVPACSHCGAALGRLRADDAPPYFTIFLVGHLLVPFIFLVERAWEPPMWLHMAVWLPLFTLVCMALLPPIKGAVVGWMLRLGIDGEGPRDSRAEPLPPASAPAPTRSAVRPGTGHG